MNYDAINNSKNRRKFHLRENKDGSCGARHPGFEALGRVTLELSITPNRSPGEPGPRVKFESVGSNHLLDASLDGGRRRCRHFLPDRGELLSLPGEYFKLLPQMIVGQRKELRR